jgi:exopolyphosphatase/guanosine-5'-triphosphate,3'-diphosphate pyrophosphatase
MSEVQHSPVVAAVDLGSNSFHLTLAQLQHNNLQIISRLKEKVRLVAGLNADGFLDQASQTRALDCLAQFRQQLQGMAPSQVRAVGTYALRKAKNSREFLLRAQQVLGFPIEVISGREEARLIYEGVAHFQHSEVKQLVIDIGGGSTEFAIGQAFEPLLLDSLQMGCVSYSQRFFADGLLNKANFKSATVAARLELMSLQDLYLREGWDQVIGTSGTVESIAAVCRELNLGNHEITEECLQKLKASLLSMGRIEAIQFEQLAENRREILPAGLAILMGIFKALKIQRMRTSPAALREGMLYELTGIEKTFDIRERAIKGILTRYHIDFDQARRVNQTALQIWQQIHSQWDISDNYYRQMLSWAARCHELGLSVNYSKQQKHGEYLLLNSDISGFSLQQQQMLALLVRAFRRKFPLQRFEIIDDPAIRQRFIRLARILRLAVLLNHRRRDVKLPPFQLDIEQEQLTLTLPDGYLEEHSLLRADLAQEQSYLAAVQLPFVFR